VAGNTEVSGRTQVGCQIANTRQYNYCMSASKEFHLSTNSVKVKGINTLFLTVTGGPVHRVR